MGISPTPSDQHRQEKRIMNEGVKISRFGIFPKVSVPVFAISALLVVLFMLYGALFSEQAGQLFSSIQAFISDKFGFFADHFDECGFGVLCVFGIESLW